MESEAELCWSKTSSARLSSSYCIAFATLSDYDCHTVLLWATTVPGVLSRHLYIDLCVAGNYLWALSYISLDSGNNCCWSSAAAAFTSVEHVTAFSFNFPTNSRLNRNCKSNKTIKTRTGYYKCLCTEDEEGKQPQQNLTPSHRPPDQFTSTAGKQNLCPDGIDPGMHSPQYVSK